MGRVDQRQSFLISVTVHLVIVTMLASSLTRKAPLPVPEPPVDADAARAKRVFLPPPEVLRRLIPVPTPPPSARAHPVPATPPPTPPPRANDRISVGDPSSGRTDKPLILRREDDLRAAPGQPRAGTEPARSAGSADREGAASSPTPAPTPAPAEARDGARPGMDLPLGTGPRTRGGASPEPGASPSPSLTASIRDLEQRLALGQLGARSGAAGRTMGPLFFDPEGADFTAWLNHFKDEVYRNWIVPQAAQFGYSRGHVDIQFVVERNGAISELNVLKSSGTPALDRAAVNALRGSRFLPLPADYGPAQVTMQVTFDYGGEGPRG